MKQVLFALRMACRFLPFAPRVEADPEVSLDFFYDHLSPYGSWIDVADYGYCFQPTVARDNANWRTYADGYWAYTDVGWTWVSYEDSVEPPTITDAGPIWPITAGFGCRDMSGGRPGSRGGPGATMSAGLRCRSLVM